MAVKIGIILGIVGIVVALLIWGIPFVVNKLRGPIIVRPSNIDLKEQPWDIQTTFWVKNRTDETLFDVWLKVTIDSYGLKSNNIQIDAENGEGLLSESTSGISIEYDFVRLDGVDGKQKECIFFILHHLVPEVTQQFTIKIKSEAEIGEDRNQRISLEIVRQSKEPVKLLKRNNEIAYPFTPPEGFTLKSISLRMKKN